MFSSSISPELLAHVAGKASPVSGVEGLSQISSASNEANSTEALELALKLHTSHRDALALLLKRRGQDRWFIDTRTKALAQFNKEWKRDFSEVEYKTILGLQDQDGRVVCGPNTTETENANATTVSSLPAPLQTGKAVFLIPSAEKDQPLKGELDSVVAELLKETDGDGAGLEVVPAASNVAAEGSKVKVCPALNIPSTSLFGQFGDVVEPIPQHIYELAVALVSAPSDVILALSGLESEEEAAYWKSLLDDAVKAKAVTVRVIVAVESPRLAFRLNEITDALAPYFAGVTIGHQAFLAAAARVFKEDPNFALPSKQNTSLVADDFFRPLHQLVAKTIGTGRGGATAGGVFPLLPEGDDLTSPASQWVLKRFLMDSLAQLKSGLQGFSVAHPSLQRIGTALAIAFRKQTAGGNAGPLAGLVQRVLVAEADQKEVLSFAGVETASPISADHPHYHRSLIGATQKDSVTNRAENIRLHVFQALQSLTSVLQSGDISTTSVAVLPQTFNGVTARVAEGLSSVERSKWSVWLDIHHKRFPVEEFIKIAHQEMMFIRKDLSNDTKTVYVKYTEHTAKWYAVAFQLLIRWMTDAEPVEFVSDSLIVFTLREVREAADPWASALRLDPRMDRSLKRLFKLN